MTSYPWFELSAGARTCTWVAGSSAVLIAVTSWQIAAFPVDAPPAGPGPYVAYYVALASWLTLGRRVLGDEGHPRSARPRHADT